MDQWLEETPYSAVRILEKLQEQEFNGKYSIVKEYVRGKKIKPILCRPYRGQTKGKVERTVQFVRSNFMVGIKYESLSDLKG